MTEPAMTCDDELPPVTQERHLEILRAWGTLTSTWAADTIIQLTEQLREAEWREMKSAPRDGTKFLACAKGPGGVGIVVARQKPGWSGWQTVPGDWSCIPTHWRPLPDPPSLGSE